MNRITTKDGYAAILAFCAAGCAMREPFAMVALRDIVSHLVDTRLYLPEMTIDRVRSMVIEANRRADFAHALVGNRGPRPKQIQIREEDFAIWWECSSGLWLAQTDNGEWYIDIGAESEYRWPAALSKLKKLGTTFNV